MFRWYCGVGRYVEAGPIGLEGGSNTFEYSRSSPTKFYDPLGLCPQCLVIPGICALGRFELIGGSLIIGGVVISNGVPSIGERPGWWPPAIPFPGDPSPVLSCGVADPSRPPIQAPRPGGDCSERFTLQASMCLEGAVGRVNKTL